MYSLAIETSGPVGSLALFDAAGACLTERKLELGRQHGQSLVPELQRMLFDLGEKPAACGLLAVSVGPGSFTGLRVGIVCAKTWAYATGCPIVAVDTHLAIAGNAPPDVSRIEIVSDAQRGDVFFSRFARGPGEPWAEAQPLDFLPVADWLARLADGDVLAGPGLERLRSQLAADRRLLEPASWVPRAAEVGRLGLAAAAAGRFADCWSLEPRYVRRSSAEEKWDLRERR